MKTIVTIHKNILSKLTRVLMCITLICLGFIANAQCTSGFNYIVDPANNGDVAFANTSSGTGLYYFWDFGDGYYSSSMNPGTHNYAGAGTYTACLTIQDSINMLDTTLGCNNTYCTIFTVINSTATCNAYFNSYDTLGTLYVSNGSSGSITDYLWDFGDGTTSTLANPGSHVYATGGTYVICLTTSNPATLCNSTYCDSTFVSSCNASFTYTPDAIGNGCNFFGSSTGPANTYFWDFGDGTTSMLQNPYHIFPANGYYYVCVTATSSIDATCNSTTCDYVNMTGVCNSYFAVQQDSANLYNYFVYNYSTSPGTLTYLWNFGDGTSSTLQYPTHTYATTTPVVLCLTISDGSCTDTYCDSITPGMMMSSTFTLNVVNPLGVHENINAIISLENYPNPFSNSTTINYAINKDANVSISIIDLLGNTIAELENGNKTSGEYSTTWNAENVAEGMYLLQLKVNNDIKTKKIIVSK
ncbi:MAG: PKD domain-containing protein [Bacteroidetes bacterium]|nr:PKD domain-containing protein [Bacteroidota bacterium]